MKRFSTTWISIFCFLLFFSHSQASWWADEGRAFLEFNKERKGVVTRPSGLQYKVVEPGTGKNPGRYSNVAVYYKGTLFNGEKFDEAPKTGAPIVLNAARVIRGWKEALPLMKEGAIWELYIPAKLGYGRQGSGKAIPPDSVLIFRLELVEVR